VEPVIIDYDICNKDGICSDVCPRKLIMMKEGLPVPIDGIENYCIRCGHCLAVCPKGAISVYGSKPANGLEMDKIQRATHGQLDHLMKSRRSIRVYKQKPVERRIIQKIMDTCRYSPTGSNAQQVDWIIATDKDKIKNLAQLTIDWMKKAVAAKHPLSTKLPMSSSIDSWERGEDPIFRGAPLVLMSHSPELGSLPLESCVIAMTYFDLVAASLGLGACWIGLFMVAASEHPPIRRALGIPTGHRLYGTMIVGYPKYKYHRIPDRNQSQVVWL
jgi:nitroreductase/NAD-dependent dihydropyrimidine dehydrogenase PreA subunit